MKTFKKVLASTLAAAMVVTALPVTPANAAAAPKLSATKATLYTGQSKTIKVTTPKTWKSVKVKATTSKKSVATVKASTKKVTVKAIKAGTAKVTVKVTGKKSGKAVKKTLKATITVKNPALTLKAANEVAVGATEQITATVKPANTKVTFTSSDETIAKVDEKGVVTGVKAGKVTITAKAGKTTKTVDMEVKTVIFKAVKQTKVDTLEATVAGNTKDLKTGDFKITNTSNNVTFAVKDVTVDAKDATKVTLTTYMKMADAKEYTVECAGTTQKFTATDGVVVAVGIDKNQITAATETEVKAVALAANDVVVDSKAYGDPKLSMAFNVTNGYLNGTKLYLNKVGDTATVDVTYHKGTFDASGKEELIEVKGLVITAVEAEKVTINGWAMKIGAAGKKFTTVTETKLAVGETKTGYIQYTNSKNEKSVDLTGYTLESSNNDALIITPDSDATSGKVSLTAVKEGTSYILVKDSKGNVVTTIPVVVVAARKATSIALDPAEVTVSKNINETADIKVTVKDQYTEDMSVASVKLDTLTFTAPNTATVNTNHEFDDTSATVINGKFQISASSKSVGKYVIKVTANDLSRTFTVNVVSTAATDKTSYAFEMPTTTADAIIKNDATANTELKAKLFKLNAGVKTAQLDAPAISVELKDAKGNDVKCGAVNAASIVSGEIVIKVNDKDTGDKVAAGSYTLTVKGAGVPTFTRTVVITDSQPAVSVKRTSDKGATLSGCFEFYYEGKKITIDGTNNTASYFLVGNNTTTPDTDAITAGSSVAVAYAVVTFKPEGSSNKVTQKVAINLTISNK
ncbi:MAG: Ig-like domain-containing protein [Lachnobacterium sp.]|nr:Ig-like domain-containing protein [Lachnobacterium sp.]